MLAGLNHTNKVRWSDKKYSIVESSFCELCVENNQVLETHVEKFEAVYLLFCDLLLYDIGLLNVLRNHKVIGNCSSYIIVMCQPFCKDLTST